MCQSIRTRLAVQRSVCVTSPIQADGSGAIRITVGQVVEEYQVQTYLAYSDALGVSLTKNDGDVYNVCLGSHDETNNICTCKGYARHSHCKHFDALSTLNNLGRLPLPIPEWSEEEMAENLALAGW
jgi:hypothetical protein